MFNLIVTCVSDKNYEGPSIQEVITYLCQKGIKDDVDKLFEEWKRMLIQYRDSSFPPEARSVYKKAMWWASIDAFNEIIEDGRLWIISCGFGFINSEEKITGYHATFQTGKKDSLYDLKYFQKLNHRDVKKQWWNLLTERGIIETDYPKSIHDLLNKSQSDDAFLLVAGKDYYEAIYDDLSKIEVSERLPELAFIGIKSLNGKFHPCIPDILEPYINSYKDWAKLRKFLKEKFGKCNNTQVHPKAAQFIIRRYNETGKLKYTFQ